MDYSGHFFTFGRAQKWSPEQCQGPDLVTVGAVNGVSRGAGHTNIMDTENSEQGAAFKSSLGKLEETKCQTQDNYHIAEEGIRKFNLTGDQ